MSENKTPCSMTRTGYCECDDVDSCSSCPLFNEWARSIVSSKAYKHCGLSMAEIREIVDRNTTPECEISSDGKCIYDSNDNYKECPKECPVYGKWLYEECRSISMLYGDAVLCKTNMSDWLENMSDWLKEHKND